MFFSTVRFLGAALLVTVLCLLLGQPILAQHRGENRRLAVVGLFSMAGNLGFLALGLQYAEPGRGAILAYTMQIWAIPLGYYLNGDRPALLKIGFGALAFVGILLLVDVSALLHGGDRGTFGYMILTCAAVNWAIGSCLYRRSAWRAPFWTQINVQLWASTVALAIATAIFEGGGAGHLTPTVGLGLVYNWLFGTALCYWWWSRVLRRMPAAQGGLVLCLIPVAALAISMTALGERLQIAGLVGAAMIVAGVSGAIASDLARAGLKAG